MWFEQRSLCTALSAIIALSVRPVYGQTTDGISEPTVALAEAAPEIVYGPHANAGNGAPPLPYVGPTRPPRDYVYLPIIQTGGREPTAEEMAELERIWSTEWERNGPARSVWRVEPGGPALVVFGGALTVGGAAFASISAASGPCRDAACGAERALKIVAGGFGGTSLGALISGYGAAVWNEDLGEADARFRRKAPRADPILAGTGIALAAAGGAMMLAGAATSITTSSDASSVSYPTSGPATVALWIGGATTFAFALPMIVLGSRKLPQSESVEVSLTAGGGQIVGRW